MEPRKFVGMAIPANIAATDQVETDAQAINRMASELASMANDISMMVDKKTDPYRRAEPENCCTEASAPQTLAPYFGNLGSHMAEIKAALRRIHSAVDRSQL